MVNACVKPNNEVKASVKPNDVVNACVKPSDRVRVNPHDAFRNVATYLEDEVLVG